MISFKKTLLFLFLLVMAIMPAITFAAALVVSDVSGNRQSGETEGYRLVFNFNTTEVTMGSVELNNVSAADYLTMLAVDNMSIEALLELLAVWDPELAASLVGASFDEILAALSHYLDPDGDGQVAVIHWDTLQERGTVGFYVERHQSGDVWVRVNNGMLPGMINAPMGAGIFLLIQA